MKNLRQAREIIPTTTTTNKLFVTITEIRVGKEANAFSQLTVGNFPRC